MAWKARGSGEAGRNPRVRPVPEPELSRIFVDGTGEASRGGREAEGDSRAATVSVGVGASLLGVLTAEVVREDMLREARKGARGEKSRVGHMGSAVNGGWLAVSVLVTRDVFAALRYSYNLVGTGAFRWGVKVGFKWYSSGIWAGTNCCSIAFERTVPCGEVRAATSWVARKASRRW